MTTSRSRRSMARTIRRAQASALITAPSCTGLTMMGLPSGPVAFSRMPVATKPGIDHGDGDPESASSMRSESKKPVMACLLAA